MVTTETPLPLSVDALRNRILNLGEEAKNELRVSWPEDCPSLLDPAITTEQLARIRTRITAIENPAPAPEVSDERVAELRDAVNALPTDLAMQLSQEANEQGVPQGLRGATAEHEAIVAKLLADQQDLVAGRRARILGRVAEFDDGPEGRIRHAIVREATGGRTESSRQVTWEEVVKVEAICDGLSLGTYMLDYDLDGNVHVALAATKVAPPPAPDQPEPIDWKAVAKEHGTTQAALLRLARQLYIDEGMEPPTRLQQVSDSMYGALLASLVTTVADDTKAAEVAARTEPDVSPYVATAAVVVVAHLPSGLRTWCIGRDHYDELVALLDNPL